MEIKTESQEKNISVQSNKERQRTPSRSFREVLEQRKSPRTPRKEKSVFDLAAKEKREEKETPQGVPDLQEAAPQVVTEGVEVVEVSPVEVSSLVEEMADYIRIESESGISKTTVKVGMEGSVFEGAEIEINHYDTAPHSFNLQLMGSPEATELFLTHLGTLQVSLNTHEALKGFQIHLMQPVLSEKSDLNNRGKSKDKRKKEAKLKGVGESLSSISKK